jgi:hypothetical protein
MKEPGPLINKPLCTVRPLMGLVRVGLATQNMDATINHLKSAQELDPGDPEVAFTVEILLGKLDQLNDQFNGTPVRAKRTSALNARNKNANLAQQLLAGCARGTGFAGRWRRPCPLPGPRRPGLN